MGSDMAADTLSRKASSRSSRLSAALTPDEWLRLGSMFAIIVALHVIGWGTLILVVEPAHLSIGDKAFGIGIGLTAYTLGLRHAFDADHIAAIDNTTRKLMNDGQRPLAVGFFFSLGHSSVVFGLALLIAFGLKAIIGPVEQDSSALHHYTSLIGTTVSGVFLYLIAIINVVILVGIVRVFVQMRRGHYDEDELEAQLNNRGLLNRLLGRFTKSVSASWHMYPIGVLFGLGFDTATEVALLVLAGTSAAAGLPWYAILCLPVVVALLIGTVELLGLLAEQFGWTSGFWSWLGGIDLNAIGFLIVGLFVVTWAGALLIWRYGRIEEKWTVQAERAG